MAHWLGRVISTGDLCFWDSDISEGAVFIYISPVNVQFSFLDGWSYFLDRWTVVSFSLPVHWINQWYETQHAFVTFVLPKGGFT